MHQASSTSGTALFFTPEYGTEEHRTITNLYPSADPKLMKDQGKASICGPFLVQTAGGHAGFDPMIARRLGDREDALLAP